MRCLLSVELAFWAGNLRFWYHFIVFSSKFTHNAELKRRQKSSKWSISHKKAEVTGRRCWLRLQEFSKTIRRPHRQTKWHFGLHQPLRSAIAYTSGLQTAETRISILSVWKMSYFPDTLVDWLYHLQCGPLIASAELEQYDQGYPQTRPRWPIFHLQCFSKSLCWCGHAHRYSHQYQWQSSKTPDYQPIVSAALFLIPTIPCLVLLYK